MSLLQMNTYRDSWAYRSTTGFPKPKQFDEQVRALATSPTGEPGHSPSRNRNQHTQQLEEINRTLSAMQFSRPSSAGPLRPSSASAKTLHPSATTGSLHNNRPQTASATRNNKAFDTWNTGRGTSPALAATTGFDFAATHTTSSTSFHPTKSLKSFTVQGNKLPHYVATDKQVLRFYCHYFDEPTQLTYQPIRNIQAASTVRYITLHYFLEDSTFEMFADKVVNSGIQGGPFYRRDVIKKCVPGGNGGSTDELLRIEELSVGGTFSVLGRDFFVTDCDEFTREYFRREFGIQLAPAIPRPSLPDPDSGAANSTGLQNVKYLSKTKKEKKTNHGTRSLDYFTKKQEFQKTQQFLACPSGACLKFDCIEWTPPSHGKSSRSSNTHSPNIVNNTIQLTGAEKHYDLIYSLSDNMVEVRTKRVSRLSADEPSLLLKKTKLPKNWRNPAPTARKNSTSGNDTEWYTYHDFHTGLILDIYGKYLLLVSCDPYTTKYYQQQLHFTQQPIKLEYLPSKVYEVEVPALGDGYLPIGSEEDTLHTVLGHPKPSKNWKKIQRNLGQIIRCRCKMITENLIDMTRVFCLTFYLEDDTLAIYEESIRNSGVVGGYFLKRGSYFNELPPEIANLPSTPSKSPSQEIVPRPFRPTDIYLGNILGVNGSIYQVVEMDDMSIRFCEENSDEFPYFDTLAIIQHVIGKVLEKRIDLREYIERYHDTDGRYWINDREFVACLEEIDIIGEMNDQEVMTVMRRFKEILEGNLIQRKNEKQKGGREGGGGTARDSLATNSQDGGSARGSGTGAYGSDGRYFYHEFCDLFSYASFLDNGKRRRDAGRRAKPAANGNRKNAKAVEKLDLLLDEMRGRLTQWRRAIRLDNHTADNCYITGGYLATVFAKNGLKLSLSDLRMIVENYSAPREVLDRDPTLIERLNRVLPSDELETTLDEDGGLTRTQLIEKQLKLKYQQLQLTLQRQEELQQKNITIPSHLHGSRTTGSATSGIGRKNRPPPTTPSLSIHREEKDLANQEKERKSAMFTRSILRTKSMESSGRGAGGVEEEEMELSRAVINYHDLCNDIYICDWSY